MTWLDLAACRDADVETFFPSEGSGTPAAALAYCRRCPVTGDCLAYAVATDSRGVWGGVGYKERARMTDRRAS